MNNFFNKKEDYIDDDLEYDEVDYLNPSMKDMDDRNKSKNKKKVKEAPEGSQFIGLSSIGNSKIFKRSGKNIENSEYISMVFRGFVFILMFLISLFGIFLIFKTPYYNMYNQKEPIILDENKELMSSNPFAKSPEDLKNEIINKDEDNVKVPTGVKSKKSISVDEDAMLRDDFENSKSTKSNNSDTDLTKLLKSNAYEDSSLNKQEDIAKDQEAINQAPSTSKKVFDNSSMQNTQAQQPVEKKQTQSDNKIVANDSNNSSYNQNNAKPQMNVAEQTTWLVTIYSTPRKDELSSRLLRLKNNYRDSLGKVTFYFVENKSPAGVSNYRISVAKTLTGIAYPSFNNTNEAKSFCSTLKAQGLDCFVSTVNKSLLPGSIIK